MAFSTVLPYQPPRFSIPEKPWPEELENILTASDGYELYRHQSFALDLARSGSHIVIATPTASGKSLVYNLTVLENVLKNSSSRALYIFPLKALAQDQLKTFEKLVSSGNIAQVTAKIYDGDTTAWHRKKIRQNSPNVLLTNPEMIHLSLLPYHQQWAEFFRNLKIVVIDEVHTYRGIMGSHMALVFRRFKRICSFYGASPIFIFCSATVSNPAHLAQQLTGLNVKAVLENGAPLGRKHFVFINPVQGPAQTAILLLQAALHRGLRTIVYTQSRKLTELISIWAQSRSGAFKGKISAYRAGLLPEERREIEARLAGGDLLAVISTSALELGIDIGDLDLCILVGYPGSVVATWQRSGRVGRNGQDSALVLIAGEDALDQYFMRHPEKFIKKDPESAVVNPYNPEILSKHIQCAAAELPLKSGESFLSNKSVKNIISELENKGKLLKSADGKEIFSSRKAPHKDVNLRGTGSRFQIVDRKTGESRGEIDGFRAFKETHPGAVYLHMGDTYLVNSLDLSTNTVTVSSARVDYYTRVRSQKDTEIMDIYEQKTVYGTTVYCGRLKVTDQVTGYEKWKMHSRKKLSIIPLDLPPLIFETEGLWFEIPIEIQREVESKYLHFMGGIHAMEHAAIGIFPLLIMADRNDLGGISTPFHPQTGKAAVFIYDGVPGGAGLSRQAFKRAGNLIEYTLDVISACPCETGCPLCVHSPKCGSGNRPIDKTSAKLILQMLLKSQFIKPKVKKHHTVKNPKQTGLSEKKISKKHTIKNPLEKIKNQLLENLYYGVMDLETRRSAKEVGGWHRADLMGVSCAVVYDSKKDIYIEYLENRIPQLIKDMQGFDLVVGFNIKRFDYRVLNGYSDFDFRKLPTLDMLEEIHNRLGYRLSLDHLAKVTLGSKKTADGLQALRWWKEGKIKKIIDYCKDDVLITKDLFLYGKKNGYLLFNNKANKTVRIPVKW